MWSTIGGDAGQHDDDRHQQLEEAGEEQARAGGFQIGAQGPLRDVLVAAPVVEVGDPLAGEIHGEPGRARYLVM